MNPKLTCRVCANISSTEEDLQKFEYVSGIYFRLTSLMPSEANLPEGACRDCCDKLYLFDSFRNMCLEAYDQLSLKAVSVVDLKHIKSEIEHQVPHESEPNAPNPAEVLQLKVETFEAGLAEPLDAESADEQDDDEDEDDDDDNVEQKAKATKSKGPKSSTKSASKEKKSKDSKYSKIHCDQCPKFFYNEERYQAHMRVHQGLKPATCEQCNREFAKFTYLKVHMEMMHSEDKQKILCDFPDCGRSFATLAGMVSHKNVKHLGKVVPKQEHVCEYCGKVFGSFSMLKLHRDKHHEGIRKHTCSVCGKSHDSRHKLKFHMLRHEGIKQYTCHICGAKKTTPTELKIHVNRHTREKKYPCGQCDAVFLSTGNKSRHVRLVHQGIKNFKCTYCDRAFGKAETLKHHVMIHTGEKPHECQLCGKRFIQLVALQTHMKTHNKHMRTAADS
ncbi:gastrula zinc finger protein XlCGF57.1 [Aedes aegypti]|uniref:C2H2-type domain-containing protein n=1 Tax=Aedes aegypti TaxID=7159 RepID=A0A1S4G1F2_AEDAE|nr:gastrula zinc finger protein XlCGF57.1 [Aedes aegypti]